MADDIATVIHNAEQMLCPKGEPHTGDDNRRDHGHTTCWVIGGLLNEIERLRDAGDALADLVRRRLPHHGWTTADREVASVVLDAWQEARRG